MSPGNTMGRVYLALKAQVTSGTFAPGDRLDPMRMTSDFASSITPVREALYRLTGERIVESWQHEGFRVPLVTEAMLRDLYVWSLELMTIVVRSARKGRYVASDSVSRQANPDFGALLLEIAARSPSHEHRAAVANLNDRSAMLRAGERAVVGDETSLDLLGAAIGDAAWSQVQALLNGHFRRRLRAVVRIAAMFPARQSG